MFMDQATEANPEGMLDRRVIIVWVLSAILGLAIFTSFFLVPTLIFSPGDLTFKLLLFTAWLASLALLAGIAYLVAWLYYGTWHYTLKEDYIELEYGLVFKREIRIPYERVQNVNTVRGPIQRLFGLSTVQVQTAGGTYYGGEHRAEGEIPGVSKETGRSIVNDIMEHVKTFRGRERALGGV